MQFVKERRGRGHQLHLLRFRTKAGDLRWFVVGVVEQPDGQWEVSGCAGGGGVDPPRDHPWINFGAWGLPRFFCGGGNVVGVDSDRAVGVRLRFANGTTLEDTVDAGVVLFMTENPSIRPPSNSLLIAAPLWPVADCSLPYLAGASIDGLTLMLLVEHGPSGACPGVGPNPTFMQLWSVPLSRLPHGNLNVVITYHDRADPEARPLTDQTPVSLTYGYQLLPG